MILPTSDMNTFKKQLSNPNINMPSESQESSVLKIQKNVVIGIQSDFTGCGILRVVQPMTYLSTIYGKSNMYNIMVTQLPITQPDILMRTRTIILQRWFSGIYNEKIKQYKELQKKYNFKLILEIDDWVFTDKSKGVEVPKYNMGHEAITEQVGKDCVDIMKQCDLITVSSEFLGDYIKKLGVDVPIKFIPNTVAGYMWGTARKRPIKDKIVRPKVLYSGSPCHYSTPKKLLGDFEGMWVEWLIKSIKENKIDFVVLGGLPYFLECVKDKIKVHDWLGTYSYHTPITSYRPDFTIAPLVTNVFNASKSDLKYVESSAVGAVLLGSVFDDSDIPSPYDIIDSRCKVGQNISVEEMDKKFWSLCEPDVYNEIVKKQYEWLVDDSRYLESEGSIKRWNDIL
jgi:hypothetical protein